MKFFLLGLAAHFANSLPVHLTHQGSGKTQFQAIVSNTNKSVSFSEFAAVLTTHRQLTHAQVKEGVGRRNDQSADWQFVPEYVGDLQSQGSELRWFTSCFNFCAVMQRDNGALLVILHLTRINEGFHKLLCQDTYFMATPFRHFAPEIALSAGTHSIVWGMVQGDELEDLKQIGVRVFCLAQSMRGTFTDIYKTVQLFRSFVSRGPAVSADVEEQNVAFLQTFASYNMEGKPEIAHIEAVDLQSGDLIGVVRLDGLDPAIMWGTGSRLGHTAIILREQDTVWVCESQSKSNYWPKDRIQKTEWHEWMMLASDADYNVVWLPLSDQSRGVFNASAALDEMTRLEGLEYGFTNFFFGWIDTAEANLPHPLSVDLLMVGFALLEPLVRRTRSTDTILRMWKPALSKRLALPEFNNLTTPELYKEAQMQGLSFSQLMSMPEQGTWEYPGVPDSTGKWKDRPGPSLVCSAMVCHLWQAGGLIPSGINCPEFTPLDVYQLKVFAPDVAPLPKNCQQLDTIAYCQVLGRRKITLAFSNIVAPFQGMREKCPSTGPDYLDRIAASWSC